MTGNEKSLVWLNTWNNISWLWLFSENQNTVIMKIEVFLRHYSINFNFKKMNFCIFRCAQCFRPFPDGIFYEFEGRKYCEHDFQVLFAPCCGKCSKIFEISFINFFCLIKWIILKKILFRWLHHWKGHQGHEC